MEKRRKSAIHHPVAEIVEKGYFPFEIYRRLRLPRSSYPIYLQKWTFWPEPFLT
jgi:hypothetical protein